MPTSESSLSVAIQGTADFLAVRMADDVVVTVDAPQRAQKQAEDADKHVLNLFAYRLVPSGFHADMGDHDPTFIRAHILLTAFPAGHGDPPPDSDLRVLGQAVRVLQSFPVIPVTLPGAAPPGAPASDFRKSQTTSYRLQAVLQAPTMEEINHVWTTQGGELAYRLSAAYELALIPIEPLVHGQPVPPVSEGQFEMVPGFGRGPYQMFQQGGRLFSHLELGAGTAQVKIALTGEPGAQAAVAVEWRRAGGTLEQQAPQTFAIKTSDVDAGDALFDVTLSGAAVGDRANLQTVIVDADGTPVKGVPPGNLITLDIGA
ncbi:Pvc16 family protein [Kordiimonas marina]|uniref:Pvc16 family protein n=1 Tax=Kordiimonas marina TaxID=2872312 RepID=UPI001FF4F2F4|nr:Pvc16 family protein [Kordiimonas marina]MCJ9429319.1 Pvc16 family protein [Kordiimonas marina]